MEGSPLVVPNSQTAHALDGSATHTTGTVEPVDRIHEMICSLLFCGMDRPNSTASKSPSWN
jgi:hypothetical protein